MNIPFPSKHAFIGRGHDGLTYRAEYPRFAKHPVWVDGRGRVVEFPPPEIWEQLGDWLFDTVGLRGVNRRRPCPATRHDCLDCAECEDSPARSG